jgi:hypothetical protein
LHSSDLFPCRNVIPDPEFGPEIAYKCVVGTWKLLYSIGILFSATGFGKTVVLFTGPDRPVSNYRAVVEQISEGDILVFSGGRQVRVGKHLGEESNTVIFERLTDQGEKTAEAIRIASRQGPRPFLNGTTYTDILEGFAKTHPALEQLGVPVVGYNSADSVPREFLVVEKLDLKLLYSDLLNKSRTFQALTKEEQERAKSAFVNFAEHTYPIRRFGDQHPGQIGYTLDGDGSSSISTATTRWHRTSGALVCSPPIL